MQLKKIAVVSALVAAVTGIAAGTANGAPADLNIGIAPDLTYTAKGDAKAATITLTNAGSLSVDNGVFQIKDNTGIVRKAAQLGFRVDSFAFPIKADVTSNGKTATLTPQFDLQHAVYKPVALPFEETAPWKTPYEREVAAFTRLKDTISTGATIGAIVGGFAGAGVGCVLGGVVGAAAGGAAGAIVVGIGALLGVPLGGLAGCIGGAAAFAFAGTLIGLGVVTAPVAAAAAIQYFTTVNAPFTPAPSSPQKVEVVPAKPAPKK